MTQKSLGSVTQKRLWVSPGSPQIMARQGASQCGKVGTTVIVLVLTCFWLEKSCPLFSQVRIWNLMKRECVRTLQAHEGFVRGMCARFCGTSFFTVSVIVRREICMLSLVIDSVRNIATHILFA